MSIERIQELEENYNKGKIIKIKAEASLTALRNTLKENNEELKRLGIVDVSKAEEELNKKKQDLEDKIKELESKLPLNIIKQYENVDFNSNIAESQPKENMDF